MDKQLSKKVMCAPHSEPHNLLGLLPDQICAQCMSLYNSCCSPIHIVKAAIIER